MAIYTHVAAMIFVAIVTVADRTIAAGKYQLLVYTDH